MSSATKPFPLDTVRRFLVEVDGVDLLAFVGMKRAKSNLISNSEYRIDMQGLTTPKDGVQYYNLQMQVNKQATNRTLKGMSRTTGGVKNFKNGTKPTVATILVNIRAGNKISASSMKAAWFDVINPKNERTLNMGRFDENGAWTKLG
ncbi:hypothetical protein MMC30_004982 [Trapelia coarctata]|nr:hypothetical protein [Trapelia coarctata]